MANAFSESYAGCYRRRRRILALFAIVYVVELAHFLSSVSSDNMSFSSTTSSSTTSIAAWAGDQKHLLLAAAVLVTLSTLAVTAWFMSGPGRRQHARSTDQPSTSSSASGNSTFLNKERQSVKLKEKIVLSPDTRLFRFALPSATPVLGLPVGKHFKVWCPNPNAKGSKWNNADDPEASKDEVERKYTPTSSDDNIGYFDLVIKVYCGKPEKFPNGGKMSQYFESLTIGDSIDLSGPYGLIEYCGKGVFKSKGREHRVSEIGMLAGGTGITPMLQIIEAIHKDSRDPTKISLIFANQTEEDILLRSRLDQLASIDKRFKVWYTLDRPPKNWAFDQGFVSKDMISKHLPSPGPATVVLMCGPPPMLKFACRPALEELSYAKDLQWEF